MANEPKLAQPRCYADVLIEGPDGHESIFEGAVIPFTTVAEGNAYLDTLLRADQVTIWVETIELLETQHLDTVTGYMVPDIRRHREAKVLWCHHIDCFREV